MEEYKINDLGVLENVVRQGKSYGHILPKELQNLNFLETYRTELIEYINESKSPIKLHKDFHHLNSSQAACLNFFFPFIFEKQHQLFLDLFSLGHDRIKNIEFEKIINPQERTNFDLYVKLESGRQIFFEVKYTEDGFGKVTNDPTYLKKYQEIYKARLEGKIIDGIPQYETLIKNYQLLRNISYLDSKSEDMLFIICPEDNVILHREYENVINNVIEPELRSNISLITWETIVTKLMTILENSPNIPWRFLEHYSLFKKKYILE